MSPVTCEVEMVVNKKCKSCVRFASKGGTAAEVCKTLYVQNEALVKLGNPERIKITIEAAQLCRGAAAGDLDRDTT